MASFVDAVKPFQSIKQNLDWTRFNFQESIIVNFMITNTKLEETFVYFGI